MTKNETRCVVHGGTTWRGGYCEHWSKPGHPTGACVQATKRRCLYGINVKEDLRDRHYDIQHACRMGGELPDDLAERYELVRCLPGSACGWMLNYHGECDNCGRRNLGPYGGPRDFNGCCSAKCLADLMCIYDTRGEA